MNWLIIIRWLIRLLGLGGVAFAVQHEARAADAAGGFDWNNLVALLTWIGGALAAWAATSGTVWQRILKFIDWFRDNPVPFQKKLDDAVRGYQAFAQCCGECHHLKATERDEALESSGKLLAKMLAHAHQHDKPETH